MTITAVLHYLVKTLKKWTLDCQTPRFGVLVLKYSSYNAVFLNHGFPQAQKTALKEECLYLNKKHFSVSSLQTRVHFITLIWYQVAKPRSLKEKNQWKYSFLSKIQNRISEKTRRKIILLSCKKFVKTQFLGVVEFPSILLVQFFKVVEHYREI